MTAVALVGFMGAGKTTVGRELAARLGWHFNDLDDLIQKREGRSIEHIFRSCGEARFRDIESSVLSDVLTRPRLEPLVLALGGGAFVQVSTQKLLQEKGVPAVFLDAPCEELFRRCEQPEVRRPLRQSFDQFSDLYEQRRAAYQKAAVRVDTASKFIPAIVDEIIATLNLGVNA
jgi:shikimate kinase